MPLSTSNFEFEGEAYDRPLPVLQYLTALIAALVVFTALLAAWEVYWRKYGATPSYRNSEGLWALQRRRINQGEGNATVLIGASRMLSNVQLHVWEKLDGKRPIQLALEGTSPVPVLEDLANDPDFKGKLYVGVAPGLFFSGYSYRQAVLDYYPKETPAQRWSQWISMKAVEPYFAFYDPDFSLTSILKRQNWPQRAGVPAYLDVRKLFNSEADRNNRLWSKLEKDVEYANLAKKIWAQEFRPRSPEEIKEGIAAFIREMDKIDAAVKKLKAKGVPVMFILHPVDGAFYEAELKHGFPRERTWNVLLQRTGVPGIHFEDYPTLQGYWLPEWSHMAAAEADRYTVELYKVIKQLEAAEVEKRK